MPRSYLLFTVLTLRIMDTNGVSMNYCELNELSILLYIMQYLKFWVIKNQTAPSPRPKFVFYPLLVCSDALVATGYIISVLQKSIITIF